MICKDCSEYHDRVSYMKLETSTDIAVSVISEPSQMIWECPHCGYYEKYHDGDLDNKFE